MRVDSAILQVLAVILKAMSVSERLETILGGHPERSEGSPSRSGSS
jgi:hypothetical protein